MCTCEHCRAEQFNTHAAAQGYPCFTQNCVHMFVRLCGSHVCKLLRQLSIQSVLLCVALGMHKPGDSLPAQTGKLLACRLLRLKNVAPALGSKPLSTLAGNRVSTFRSAQAGNMEVSKKKPDQTMAQCVHPSNFADMLLRSV